MKETITIMFQFQDPLLLLILVLYGDEDMQEEEKEDLQEGDWPIEILQDNILKILVDEVPLKMKVLIQGYLEMMVLNLEMTVLNLKCFKMSLLNLSYSQNPLLLEQ